MLHPGGVSCVSLPLGAPEGLQGLDPRHLPGGSVGLLRTQTVGPFGELRCCHGPILGQMRVWGPCGSELSLLPGVEHFQHRWDGR